MLSTAAHAHSTPSSKAALVSQQELAAVHKVSCKSHGQQHSEQETDMVFMRPGKQFPGEKEHESTRQHLRLT